MASLSSPSFPPPQLLVGSEDFDIRVFKEDELVTEMTENEVNVHFSAAAAAAGLASPN